MVRRDRDPGTGDGNAHVGSEACRTCSRICGRLPRSATPTRFISTFAFPLPVHVICELLGVPAADRPMFHSLVHDWTTVLEALTPVDIDRADAAAVAVHDYFADLIATRRAVPAGDLISGLAAATDAGSDRLRTVPDLAQPAAEELLRYDSPIQLVAARAAPVGLRVGGLVLPADQPVTALIGAANRDPEAFCESDRLVLDSGPLAAASGFHRDRQWVHRAAGQRGSRPRGNDGRLDVPERPPVEQD